MTFTETRSPLLTVSDVAERLGLGPPTVRRLIRQGHMPAIRLPGGQYRVEGAALDAYLADRRL